MRADPDLMKVFEWAQRGDLPNIKALMDRGAWGYSVPTFPTHTPTNFATLLTGTYPERHGVADGPMHVEGQPLRRPSVGGFSSVARKLPAVWSLLEGAGKRPFLLSVPGSTPPELLAGGITVRGRWGGWGADLHSMVFEQASPERLLEVGRGARLFFLGDDLTRFIKSRPAKGWTGTEAKAAIGEVELTGHGLTLHALLEDSDGDGTSDAVRFSRDRGQAIARLQPGEWSDWIPVVLRWNKLDVPSHVRLHVIRLGPDGFFRIRMVVDSLNRFVTEPGSVADELHADLGPMVDFVDNFPPQLIFYDEDRTTFIDEARMSLEWHRRAVGAVAKRYRPDVFIHDIYTPNQMLTSRWWLGYVDPTSSRYSEVDDNERGQLMGEVMDMYRGLDAIVGEALKHAGPDTLVVLSSDHGAAPLDRWVRLNNLFASRGWLVFKQDERTGAPVVDWNRSKVVYLKMDSIYIRPDGLGGDWTRGSGPEYDRLRAEVRDALLELEDEGGTRPVAAVKGWEEVGTFYRLPSDRVGDLVIANRPGYGWNEELTRDLKVFGTPLKTGYKQAILPGESKAMWTPFVVAGPGVKPGTRIEQPIQHVDQLPTLLRLMGQPIPEHVQGRVLTEILIAPQ